MNKKKLLVVGIILMLSLISVAIISIGQIFTQNEIDVWSENQIRDKIIFSICDFEKKGGKTIFFLCYPSLDYQDGNYSVEPMKKKVKMQNERINNCITENSKAYCWNNFVIPYLEQQARELEDEEVERIIGYQSQTDLFTMQDLENIIDSVELN